MAVCSKDNVSRFDIERFCHELMADAVASVDVLHAVFFRKLIADSKMSRVIHLTCRHQMVVDQHHLVRIPESGKSHLFKFFRHKGDKDIMDHDPVHMDRDDIARLYLMSHIAAYDLFDDCLSHSFIPPVRSGGAWPLPVRRHR